MGAIAWLTIREFFAQTDEAKKRGFGPATFSFNVKGGRCEECAGDGTIVTQLSFMPHVEVTCPACKGRRYREETLEVTWQGRNIAELLKLSIEECVSFFKDQRPIARKLEVLCELGLALEFSCPGPLRLRQLRSVAAVSKCAVPSSAACFLLAFTIGPR